MLETAWILKILGAAAVVAASTGIGLRRNAALRREIDCLDGLCHAVTLLRAELMSRLAPTEELLRCAAANSEGETADFFAWVLRNMDKLGERSFSEIWRDGAVRCLTSLPEEQRGALDRLGAALGRYELREQAAACDAFLRGARETLDARRSAFPQRRRLDLALGAAGGLLLCLVLF